VLAVTRDPFVVFTSNVFAILGLRAMYFALAGILKLFKFLHYGLSAILVFIGVKMLLSDTPYSIGTVQSLVVVFALLVVSVSASLIIRKE
jgi:tellurite resistance protein TerC